jgi:hypothetical protein
LRPIPAKADGRSQQEPTARADDRSQQKPTVDPSKSRRQEPTVDPDTLGLLLSVAAAGVCSGIILESPDKRLENSWFKSFSRGDFPMTLTSCSVK